MIRVVVIGVFTTGMACAAPARPLGDMLGLGVKFSQGQPMSDLPMLDDLGVHWVRDVVPWTDIEPQAGRYAASFPPVLDKRLAYYRDHGIALIALLTLGNANAYPPQGGSAARAYDPDAFGRYAATVARMLRDKGLRFVIEVGNEPHNSALAKQLGGNWTGRAPSPWVDHYVRMVAAAVREVKAVDPSLRLLSSDDMWIVHYWFLEAGLPAALDGFAVHPYVKGPPELTAVAPDTDWTRPFVTVDADRSFSSAVRRLREQGRAKLGHEPSVWITEWGWPVEGPGAPPKSVSDETLAAYLPRAFIVANAAGVEAMCWFSAWDAGDGPMGLTDRGGRRRAAYQAYRVLSQRLGRQSLVRQVAGSDRPATGVQAYLFQGADGQDRTLVLWSVEGTARWVPLAGDDETAVDALGRDVTPEPRGGQRGVAFGAMPIYVRGGWSDAAIAAVVQAIE